MAADRIPGFSAADMAALDVLAQCNAVTQAAVRELAEHQGIELAPQPGPRRRGRLRYTNITRHAPGDVTADVVNTETGETRQFRFQKNGDGEIDVKEL
jgi:hypothetical protein